MYQLQYAYADEPNTYLTWSHYQDRHDAENALTVVRATDTALAIDRTWRVHNAARARVADLIVGWRNEA
jgi:hypothetical protein